MRLLSINMFLLFILNYFIAQEGPGVVRENGAVEVVSTLLAQSQSIRVKVCNIIIICISFIYLNLFFNTAIMRSGCGSCFTT